MNELIAFLIAMKVECKKHKPNCYDGECPYFENEGHNQPICNYFDDAGIPADWTDDDIKMLNGEVKSLREEMAELCHEQWSGWMKWMLEKVELKLKDAPDPNYPETWIERWKRQMNASFDELSEAEKESDRAEADKFLRLMNKKSVTSFLDKMIELEDQAYCPHGFMVGCPTCTKKPIEPTFDI